MKKSAIQNLGKADGEKFIADLPQFKSKYQTWYSESLALIRQLLPDRVEGFASYYESPKTRKRLIMALTLCATI
jgi:hypothetical protein